MNFGFLLRTVGLGLIHFSLVLFPFLSFGTDYQNHKELSRTVKDMSGGNPKLVRVSSLARSSASRDVWVLEIGTGSAQKGPAMVAIAGIEGHDLLGSASLLHWAQTLVDNYEADRSIQTLLDSSTLYIIPRLNPDAAESFFATPRMETRVNLSPTDDDHDGLTDEDGPDNVDGDGLITWMRVKDPDGEYELDPKEPRLLIKAEPAKGHAGNWKLFPEGLDEDKDELWNEDGSGGINFNHNFPYNFRFFGSTSGLHPMSDPITRGLADFIVAHPEISVVFSFGSVDNLLQAPKAEPPKSPPINVHETDVPFLRELGKAWRDAMGLSKELKAQTEPGSFSDWIYFHRGRLSLAAQPWSPSIQLSLSSKKPEEESKPPTNGETNQPSATVGKPQGSKTEPQEDESAKANQEERAFLKWLTENAPESFVEWKSVVHPDFAGKTVEVGGFVPFSKVNPPAAHLQQWMEKHAAFLTATARKLPRIAIRDVKVKPLGNSLFDVVIQVENVGYLPTSMAQGEVSREVFPTRVDLDLDSQAVLSGQNRAVLPTIPGSGGMKEARFLVNGNGPKSVKIKVTSMLAGSATAEIPLAQEN